MKVSKANFVIVEVINWGCSLYSNGLRLKDLSAILNDWAAVGKEQEKL